jgi:hypothetical protein
MRTPFLPVFVASLALASCTQDTTSFRSTDRVDSSDPSAPAPGVYDIAKVARVRAWSPGGYIGTSEEPMTQVTVQIENVGKRPIVFDGERASLAIFDDTGAALPTPELTSIVPLGPAQLAIAPGKSAKLDMHFKLGVKLTRVNTMQAHWVLVAVGERIAQTASFVRDDDGASNHAPSAR